MAALHRKNSATSGETTTDTRATTSSSAAAVAAPTHGSRRNGPCRTTVYRARKRVTSVCSQTFAAHWATKTAAMTAKAESG